MVWAICRKTVIHSVSSVVPIAIMLGINREQTAIRPDPERWGIMVITTRFFMDYRPAKDFFSLRS